MIGVIVHFRFFLISSIILFSLFVNVIFCTPIVKSIHPAVGPSVGGTVMRIKGKGFDETTSVLFGDIPASFTVDSDTLITAKSPPHSPQVVLVTVVSSESSTHTDFNESCVNTSRSFFTFQGDWQGFVSNFDLFPSSISVLRIRDDTPIASSEGDLSAAIALSPDGSNSRTIDHVVIASPEAGVQPIAFAIPSDGEKAYIVKLDNDFPSIASEIRTADEVLDSIEEGLFPTAIAITPDRAKAYVVYSNSNTVSIISTLGDSVVGKIRVGMTPITIAITPDQAPLASFTATQEHDDFAVKFNASASVSPVGTIANYFWDFGDGSTLSTSWPITTHDFAKTGSFSVTLTVTNSAGTSTKQIISHSASYFIGLQGEVITHNGGPTATTTQIITIRPLPPRNLHGRQDKLEFATQTDLVNILTWKPPRGTSPVTYRIYRNKRLTKLAAEISAKKELRFKDHNRKKGRIYHYFVVSVDRFGLLSDPAIVVINPTMLSFFTLWAK
jgi:YVTN family beta-propeller protein